MADLERIGVAVDRELLERFDKLLERVGHTNRSEAIRDLIRDRLVEEESYGGKGEAVGTLTLVYDHTKRDLSDKLVSTGHEHHDAILASMHLHLDETYCLEVMAVRGRPAVLRRLADHLLGMKGVKHGKLVISSAEF